MGIQWGINKILIFLELKSSKKIRFLSVLGFVPISLGCGLRGRHNVQHSRRVGVGVGKEHGVGEGSDGFQSRGGKESCLDGKLLCLHKPHWSGTNPIYLAGLF